MAVPLLSPTRRVYLIGDEKELAENGRLWKELNLGHELARDLRALYKTRSSGPGRNNWHNLLMNVVWVGHPKRRLVVPVYGTLRDRHELIKVYEPHIDHGKFTRLLNQRKRVAKEGWQLTYMPDVVKALKDGEQLQPSYTVSDFARPSP